MPRVHQGRSRSSDGDWASIMLSEALGYAEIGWGVFPVAGVADGECACRAGRGCSSPGKHPLTPTGFRDATDDPVRVAAWWGKRWPGANIGGVPPAGVVVVDVDPRNGGESSLYRLQRAHGVLPQTVTACTGGGGSHYYFAVPVGAGPVVAKLAEGIDVKVGATGFVVVPPSLHHSGERYRWEVPPGLQRPVPAPEWLVGLLVKPQRARKPPRARRSTSWRRRRFCGYSSEYCSTALDGEVEAVRSAPEGERNTTLNRAAFNLGTLVGAGGDIDVDEVIDALVEAGAEAGLDDAEVEATITSGLDAGLDNPRES